MTAISLSPAPRTSPGTVRPETDGQMVRFGVFSTVLGRMIIAGTDHGVSHVAFGDDDTVLEQQLLETFANASVRRDDAAVAAWARGISSQLEGKATTIDVPLDVAGTPFQQRVWTELRRIPFGELRSYQELAILIGQPTAVRAVAGACARNRVAVVIPCHRVIRGSGELGGYRWGVERKRKLLALEKSRA